MNQEIIQKLIQNGVKSLKEFGFYVTTENIITDGVYSAFFYSMLTKELGKGVDSEIKYLLNEIGKIKEENTEIKKDELLMENVMGLIKKHHSIVNKIEELQDEEDLLSKEILEATKSLNRKELLEIYPKIKNSEAKYNLFLRITKEEKTQNLT